MACACARDRERGPKTAGVEASLQDILDSHQLGAIFEAADRKLSESIFNEVALSRCEQIIPGRSFLPKRRFSSCQRVMPVPCVEIPNRR